MNLWLLVGLTIIGMVTFFGVTTKFADITNRLPSSASEDVKDLTKSFPLDDLKQFLFGGMQGLLKWFAQLANTLAKWIINFLRPGATVPDYYGFILLGLIVVFFLWRTVGTFHEFGYEILKMLFFIGGGIFILFTTLVFLGVLK